MKAALALNEEHTPGNAGRRNAISDLLMSAYIKAGRVDEATEVGMANVRRNDVLLTDIWSQSQEGLTHRSSALACPDSMAGMVRIKTTNYRPTGNDVSCTYRQLTGVLNEVTLYFTNHGESFDNQREAHNAAATAMARTANKQNGTLVTEHVKLPSEVSYMIDITETVYEYGRGDMHNYTGAWTSIIEGWVLKTRVTWDASLGAAYGRSKTKAVFKQSSQNVSQHLKSCDAEKWPEKGEPTTKMALEYLMLEILLDQNKAQTLRPGTECFILASNQGNAFLVGHPGHNRVYTIDGTAVDADVYVEPAKGIGGKEVLDRQSGYVLKFKKGATDDALAFTEIMTAYDTKPGPTQVFTDFVDILSRDAEPYGKIEFSENGDTKILMNPNLTGNEED